MGTLNNCCNCNSLENKNETKLQANLFTFFRQQDSNKNYHNFLIIRNSNYEREKNLKKIRQKFAIKKILKQFKKYKSKNEILTPINKSNNNSIIINTSSYSDLLSTIKMKKVSNFFYNKNVIGKLLNEKENPDVLCNVIEFNTSTSSLYNNKDNFQKYLDKFLKYNKNYITYYKNHLQKQKGIVQLYLGENNFYIGQFFRNDFCGYGLFINNRNIIYEGYWKNNMQNGYGIESWENDSFYQGEYANGCKCGIGTYIWPDKSKYEGEWNNNCFDGYGIYYYSDNNIYFGNWKMNVKCGYGVYLTKDTIYIGNYFNDKKNGFGIYYWRKKEEAFIGFFNEGKQKGFGKYISNNKSKYGIWNYDKKNNNSKAKWFKNIIDVHKILSKNGLENYKYFFLFNIEDIKNYCNIIIDDEILDLSIN